MEGILEPGATVQGVTFPIMLLSHDRLPDLSSEVTFELLEDQSDGCYGLRSIVVFGVQYWTS